MQCVLCSRPTEEILYEDKQLLIILADEEDYAGICRVIWKAHTKEMSDLTTIERCHLMEWVWSTEIALRAELQPDKINLASLGNKVPHLHWHIIPRFTNDAHFPSPIWATPCRHPSPHKSDPLFAARLRFRLSGTY